MLGYKEEIASLDQVQSVVRTLPLERCSFEQNPITQEFGWRAPNGFGFRMTRQFQVDSEQEDITHWYRPQESRDLFLTQNRQRYRELLLEMDGSEELALEELLSEEEEYEGELDLPESFIGRWFVVRPNPLTVFVKEDIRAWYVADTLRVPNVTEDPDKKVPATFMSKEITPVWKQYYAAGVPGLFEIELVDVPEVAPKLLLPKQDEEIVLPFEYMPVRTAKVTCEYYMIEPTEENILSFMRSRRLQGMPFEDDPLRDLIILTGSKADDYLNGLRV